VRERESVSRSDSGVGDRGGWEDDDRPRAHEEEGVREGEKMWWCTMTSSWSMPPLAVFPASLAVGFLLGLRLRASKDARAQDAKAHSDAEVVRELMRRALAEEPRLAWSALQCAQAIRTGQVSSEEICEMFIRHHHRISPYLNCVVATRFADALLEARKADERIKSKEENPPPFLGVPLISKEVFEYPGMPYTSGLVTRANRKGQTKSPAVQRLEDAGFIVLGVGNISEACMWMESSNKVYGVSNNHYDIKRTVGGSSGGTSGAVSALCAPVGLTSDVGGSTRIPAHFNGLFGHKPTGGTVPNVGTIPKVVGRVNLYCQLGPTARHAEDLIPMLDVLSGHAPDPLNAYPLHPTKPKPVMPWARSVNVSKLKVLDVRNQPGTKGFLGLIAKRRQSCMLDAQDKVIQHLAGLGCEVKKIEFPLMDEAFDIWGSVFGFPVFLVFARKIDDLNI